MFPNVRLQIVAVFVSIVALTCGFGVFAAFRVNNEPLGRLPSAVAPLQLVAEDSGPPGSMPGGSVSWGAPFGSQFRVSEVQISRTADNEPALTPVRHDATERPNVWAVVPGGTANAPPPHALDSAAPPAAVSGSATAISEVPVEQAPASLPDTQTVHASSPEKQSDTVVKAGEPASVVATVKPAAPVPTETVDSAPKDVAPATKVIRKTSESAQRKLGRATETHRRVAVRRPAVSQTGIRSAGQNSKFEEPVVFQTAPPPYRPQKGARFVVRSNGANSISEQPVFQTAPSAVQH
jgi:hypothetical protein